MIDLSIISQQNKNVEETKNTDQNRTNNNASVFTKQNTKTDFENIYNDEDKFKSKDLIRNASVTKEKHNQKKRRKK